MRSPSSYRYIRHRKLIALRLVRSYRVPARSLDLLFWATRTRADITLREYTAAEMDDFLVDDQLDEAAQSIAVRFAAAPNP
jgi:hypothetical protein